MRKAAHVLLVGLVSFACYHAALACCPDDPDATLDAKVMLALQAADFVFVGKVEGFQYTRDIDDPDIQQVLSRNPLAQIQIVKFTSSVWWRGPVVREVRMMNNDVARIDGVVSLLSPGSYGFEHGKTYLVFANRRGSFIENIGCFLTADVTNRASQEVIKLLGDGDLVPSDMQ